jgi:hypothetical protein
MEEAIMKLGLGLALASLLVAGCGGGAPHRALRSYGAALGEGDFGQAYSMMSEEFRSEFTRDEFIKMMQSNKREVSETANRLRKSPSRVEVSAEFHYGFGDALRLVEEGGQWKIDSDPMVFYSQKTPQQSLRSFLRAYRLKRWDVMLRFVPKTYAERMNVERIKEQFDGPGRDEIAQRVTMLEANLDGPVSEKGNQARMPYGEKYEVKFVRESGLWKIRDID